MLAHTMASRMRLAGVAIGLLVLPTVATHAQMAAPPDFLVTVPSSKSFDDVLASLKQAIEGENLMVVDEINPQQMLRLVGMRTRGMRQVLFFHPRYMKQIIETNMNGGIEPPLKLLVMERPDGTVMIRYHDPVHQFAPYEGLQGVATELRGTIERIVASAR